MTSVEAERRARSDVLARQTHAPLRRHLARRADPDLVDDVLAEALAGLSYTATAVTDHQVTLSVDRWYRGTAAQERAEVVTLAVPGGAAPVALDGIAFSKGTQYLVAATDGTGNG